MKHLLLIACTSLIGLSSSAQCINGVLMEPIHDLGSELVSVIDSLEYEIVRMEYDLIFTKKESFRTLTSDWEYYIFAFADGGVKDLNMKLYGLNEETNEWDFVASDMEEYENAYIVTKPPSTGNYKIVLEIAEFFEGYTAARYGLMYAHE